MPPSPNWDGLPPGTYETYLILLLGPSPTWKVDATITKLGWTTYIWILAYLCYEHGWRVSLICGTYDIQVCVKPYTLTLHNLIAHAHNVTQLIHSIISLWSYRRISALHFDVTVSTNGKYFTCKCYHHKVLKPHMFLCGIHFSLITFCVYCALLWEITWLYSSDVFIFIYN